MNLHSWPRHEYISLPLTGVFFCPYCSSRQMVELSPELSELELLRKLPLQPWMIENPRACPECGRLLVLEKVLDAEGRTLFDSYQWVCREGARLKKCS